MQQPKIILVRWEKEPLARSGMVARAYYADMRPLYIADEYSAILQDRVLGVENVQEFRYLNIPNDVH